jgi:hypothetical protein
MRLSLNTPVLSTAELPAGPARAVIVAYLEGSARRFAVIARSLRAGVTAIYELEGEDAHDADAWSVVALDSALSFGESMGFVFDDEMLVDRRAETLRRGLAHLHEILAAPSIDGAEEAPRGAPEPAAEIGAPGELAEILLEDAVEAFDPGSLDRGHDAAPAPEPRAAEAARLSKFRSPPPSPSPAPEPVAQAAAKPQPARGPATLGRVRPVRVRVDGETAPRVDPLLRLLADF